MKKVFLVFVATIVLLVMGGCDFKVTVKKSDEVSKVVISSTSDVINADNNNAVSFSVKVFNSDDEEILNKTVDIYKDGVKFTEDSFYTTTSGEYIFLAKVDGVESNSIVVTVNNDGKMTVENNSAGAMHGVEWISGDKSYYFSETEEDSIWTESGKIDSLLVGDSNTKLVNPGESFLYFSISGQNGFAYFRTKDKITISDFDIKNVEIVIDTPVQETDENQNDLTRKFAVIITSVNKSGKRAINRYEVINVIKGE
ncbi:hypothetical protein [Haliovirga abyssi]|uniref:CARDB domain-containing protein n=1 Tax=Haliovirga abyssi TaxID=2996794 RepID=A0AAU9D9S3_9FUSO|nr:hypothetical protein [Haliovirga abyssi]BDU50065.1 hypothetical protein HLVA_06340 [Haliovirga abyssi]